MAKVIYTPKNKEVFCDLEEGTYFDYKGGLYLLVDKERGLVFDFENGTTFVWNWCVDFYVDAPVKSISSDRITIEVD